MAIGSAGLSLCPRGGLRVEGRISNEASPVFVRPPLDFLASVATRPAPSPSEPTRL